MSSNPSRQARPAHAQRGALRAPLLMTSLALALMTIGQAASAQQRDNPATLAGAHSLAPVLVTATRSPQSAVNLVSDIESVSLRGLRTDGALSTVDRLSTLSGVSVVRNGGPGGKHDGTYVQDWQYTGGSGKLDKCNGGSLDGKVVYFITDSYPYLPHCAWGKVSRDFGRP